ncbi:voltage-gated potassium channel [Litorivivens lipolytica]|uniref:Voltage-gated potassium channel n=1 Tax=Litorivivens lipolytica TaxID=1524264 RepID=A0A7W4Z8E4_9GAMM|nr:ion transporter [Litorivivens lipolytica]MBB3048935.1 voltage-gated potassium channel [Litorivivens lipolytica]
MKAQLQNIVETRETLAGKIFDTVIQCAIVVSLISFSIETLPTISTDLRNTLRAIELSVVALFTAEYLLRFYVASSRPKFVFSFYGIVDLLAVAPFYIAGGLNLSPLRALRLLRLFKLLRYSRAITRLSRAFGKIKDELVLYGAASLIVLYLAAAGIYLFENPVQPDAFPSVFHSLWWAVATLTTVGYGDVYPITAGGRIFTTFILVIGLGVVAVPSGMLASALTEVRDEEKMNSLGGGDND